MPCKGQADRSLNVRSLLISTQQNVDSNIIPGHLIQSVTLSPPKAFGLSLILPGLGQRYVNGGQWRGWATTFALADAGLWVALFGSEWHSDQLIESYTTLAATSASADVHGKDRSYFLNLATYRSSQEFLDVVLRNRAWDQIGYVDSPSFQWDWSNEQDFFRYRELRDDAETLRRRRSVIIASLVANRLISGIMAAWKATRINTQNMTISLGPPPPYSSLPRLRLKARL